MSPVRSVLQPTWSRIGPTGYRKALRERRADLGEPPPEGLLFGDGNALQRGGSGKRGQVEGTFRISAAEIQEVPSAVFADKRFDPVPPW